MRRKLIDFGSCSCASMVVV